MKNPFHLQDLPGGTETLGWLGAWTAAPSAYAVAAAAPGDVVAAVNFARTHGLRVAIKGTGHDYLGRSTAPDSLLVWTHAMRDITVEDAFVPHGCPSPPAGVPAVTVGAGTRWLEAYQAVTVAHHRYVQGGGCTSVGAAGGFLQGGGFGSWSKKFGIAAAGMLEAEVVTADGVRRVANACQNQDLFWALRGGGGGTFGVVTKVTLMTHPLPAKFAGVSGKVKAKDAAAFPELLEKFLEFYAASLNNESWGEQVRIRRDALEVSMNAQGMSKADAERVWSPFRAWVDQHGDTMSADLHFWELPASEMWDPAVLGKQPGVIERDDRPGPPSSLFWWNGDGSQVATYWYAYTSRWIPLARLQGAEAKGFAKVLFDASRQWPIELHFNKGQAGASEEARRRDRDTSMNPAVLDAAALAIIAADRGAYAAPHEDRAGAARSTTPKPEAAHVPSEGEEERALVNAAIKILRDATPGAGSYVNETDYFEPDWQHAFWGDNYPRLLSIKRKYDPDGLFVCHHCVGSETTERR
jgi:FAD/FMN-containing dehydrogenase